MNFENDPIYIKYMELKNKAMDEIIFKTKSCSNYNDLPNFFVMIIRKYNKEWNEFFKDDPDIAINGFQYLIAESVMELNFPKNVKNAIWYLLPKEERS
jgi:hypothetical protein